VTTPEEVGIAMLRLAAVGPEDVVYDLGSGDGRLVLTAARRFGARGVGVEIDGPLVQSSRERAFAEGVADRVSFLWQDLFVTDLSPATVVTLYLGEDVNRRLRPKLLAELRPGARVVSHEFALGDWTPDRVVRVPGPERTHTLYLWVVPARAGGTWQGTARWSGRELAFHLELQQAYQRLWGTLTLADRTHRLDGALHGDRLVLSGSALVLEGQVGPALAEGTLRTPAGDTGTWTAARRP
jgi:SAM-dependent methyltransferase